MATDERDLALVATLLRHSLELQAHLAMAICAGKVPSQGVELVSTDLSRLAQALDEHSGDAFPPDLAVLLHTTSVRVRDLGDRGER